MYDLSSLSDVPSGLKSILISLEPTELLKIHIHKFLYIVDILIYSLFIVDVEVYVSVKRKSKESLVKFCFTCFWSTHPVKKKNVWLKIQDNNK